MPWLLGGRTGGSLPLGAAFGAVVVSDRLGSGGGGLSIGKPRGPGG